MARRCNLTGKGVQSGNNVSHALNRTRRRFLPNLQKASLLSETLGETIRLRVSTHALRTVEHKGGLDAFLLSEKAESLPRDLRRLRARLVKAKAETAAS